MIPLSRTIIVEGRYDKARLAGIFEANIIQTDGFQIFSDKKLLELIKNLAQKDGIIVATDSDRAGFVIRQHIASAVPPDIIIHFYIPDFYGKESRKEKPSCEGKLGVEGIDNDLLIQAFKQAGALEEDNSKTENQRPITKTDLYELGLTGTTGSGSLRLALKERLNLPERLGTNALLATLNKILSYQQLCSLIEHLEA